MIARRAVLTGSAALLASLSFSRAGFAQGFPSKPIKIVVPFPPGGPADTAVRIAQPGMEKALGTDHSKTLAVVHSLGKSFKNKGNIEMAEQMYQRAMHGLEKASSLS